ncbi:alpha/beta fold hydrolase [Streptomyces sp. NPDC057580]|uniref:alpha/beta fold hydrolase n=1 Tax=Streptomyces sp. NPDC057580 TaxID=3346173 RepID=UPI0036B93E35
MRGPVLIAGRPRSLATALAARYLSATTAKVILLSAECHLVDRVLARLPPRERRDARTRLIHVPLVKAPDGMLVPEPHDGGTDVSADEVWCLATGCDPDRERGDAQDAALTRTLLSLLPDLDARSFGHVGPARPVQARSHPQPLPEGPWPGQPREDEVASRCAELGIVAHIVRTDPAADRPGAPPDDRDGGLLHLLTTLEAVREELDERAPGYLRDRPLRLHAHPGAALGALPVDRIATALVSLAGRTGPDCRYVNLVAAEPVPVPELCRRLSTGYGITVTAVDDPAQLNPVDRQLADRLGATMDQLGGPAVERRRDHPVASAVDGSPLDGPALSSLIGSVRAGQRMRGDTVRARGKELRDRTPTVITARDGAPLSYLTAGTVGPPLLLLNALGYRTRWWHRLIGHLAPRRVIAWDPRGVHDTGPVPSAVAGQADDAEAIMDHEGIESCHVAAWCTGPRVALELYRRRPDAIGAMVFLNGSFKQLGRSDGLDTPYERDLEFLCTTLAAQPYLVGRLMSLFGAAPADEDGTDPDTVLRQVVPALRAEVRAPFATGPTLLRYAAQLLDLWSHDPLAGAAELRVPVLSLGGEYDDIASPERLRDAVRTFPDARHVRLPGATHYLLHERAQEVSELIGDFLLDATTRVPARRRPRS